MQYTHGDLRQALCHYMQLQVLVERIPFTVTTPPQTVERLLGLWFDLNHGLQSLSARQREAVFYCLILSASEAEGATRLHITRQALHARVENALQAMAILLNGEGGDVDV